MTIAVKRRQLEVPERQIAIGLIVSDEFTKTIAPILDLDLIQSRYVRMVCQWCIEYFTQYEKAPNDTIQAIFESQKPAIDGDVAELIGTFLSSISNEFDRQQKFNTEYILHQAESYLQAQKLRKLSNDVKALLQSNRLLEAESIVAGFSAPRLSRVSDSIDVFHDLETVRQLLDTTEKDIVLQFPGQLGRLVNDSCRGELLAFSGPEKRGKSWWLQWISLLSVMEGFNVALFCLEMTKKQMLQRIMSYLTGRPIKKRYSEMEIPHLVRGVVRYRKENREVLDPSYGVKKLKSLLPMTRSGRLQLICWPPSTKSLVDIHAQMALWEAQQDFIPDLIVVDHADRLSPTGYTRDYRHGLDSIWEGLKSMALQRHCLVATATHTTKDAHEKRITRKTATAEDKRKGGHVDRMIGLNQSEKEKKQGLMRVNCIYDRNEDDSGHMDVMVLQQLAIGRPYLDSFISERTDIQE